MRMQIQLNRFQINLKQCEIKEKPGSIFRPWKPVDPGCFPALSWWEKSLFKEWEEIIYCIQDLDHCCEDIKKFGGCTVVVTYPEVKLS